MFEDPQGNSNTAAKVELKQSCELIVVRLTQAPNDFRNGVYFDTKGPSSRIRRGFQQNDARLWANDEAKEASVRSLELPKQDRGCLARRTHACKVHREADF